MNLQSCGDTKDFGGDDGILILSTFIFCISLFFWILPSCALLSGVKRNQSCMFVPWILSMGFQSPLLAWALVAHFDEIVEHYRTIEIQKYRNTGMHKIIGISLGVTLLPILALILMQIIVWRACLRIKRNRGQNTNRYLHKLKLKA